MKVLYNSSVFIASASYGRSGFETNTACRHDHAGELALDRAKAGPNCQDGPYPFRTFFSGQFTFCFQDNPGWVTDRLQIEEFPAVTRCFVSHQGAIACGAGMRSVASAPLCNGRSGCACPSQYFGCPQQPPRRQVGCSYPNARYQVKVSAFAVSCICAITGRRPRARISAD